jgi:hypothetical protein
LKQNYSSVIVAFYPCQQLSKVHWTFWRLNSLILLPQTFFLANSLQLNLNSRVYYLDEEDRLHEIYRYNLDDINYTYKALGNTSSRDFHHTVKYIWERRTDLSTIHINIKYINFYPFTMVKHPQEVQGFLGELFLMVQEKLQFKYHLSEQIDKCWGSLLDNGSYSCMFGKIQQGESNWSIAGK